MIFDNNRGRWSRVSPPRPGEPSGATGFGGLSFSGFQTGASEP